MEAAPWLPELAAAQGQQLLQQRTGPEPYPTLMMGWAPWLQAVMQADVEIVNNHSVPVEIKVSIIIHKPTHQ